MPKRKFGRQDILRAAAEVVRKAGTEGLNVRSVARELGCSTQPVYSQFENMATMKAALRDEAARIYREKIDGYLKEPNRNRYEAFGLGFVRFAREERGLFGFLYLARRETACFPDEEDPYLEEIIREMTVIYGMDEARARRFHRDMSVYSFALAVLACRGAAFSDEEIEAGLRRQFYALYRYYFPERPPLTEKIERERL